MYNRIKTEYQDDNLSLVKSSPRSSNDCSRNIIFNFYKMDHYSIVKKHILQIDEIDEEDDITIKEKYEMEDINLIPKDTEFSKINDLYEECLKYLQEEKVDDFDINSIIDPDYESINDRTESNIKNEEKDDFQEIGESNFDENTKEEVKYDFESKNEKDQEIVSENEVIDEIPKAKSIYKIENELKSNDSLNSVVSENRSDRLRKLSQQLPKIIITQSNTSLNVRRHGDIVVRHQWNLKFNDINMKEHQCDSEKDLSTKAHNKRNYDAFDNISEHRKPLSRSRPGSGDFPKRLVAKRGTENIALISNIPFEKIRLLNDTFHTLINLRWRWIVSGTIVVHFAIWLVFAIFWYIVALAHYDFEPNPPARTCVTGGHDFLTIFLASVEAQTTIGFGDRAIDEECPESIFLFIMQLILGTGLSGVLTCVVYAKLTRPEKLSRDGVGFSRKAVISMRDGRLCLMMRAWDLNYDHIISSEFTAHFVHTYRTKEGELIRYYAESLSLQQRQFLLWPVTLVHVIDDTSPLYAYGPEHISNSHYEITVSLKGASASMGTFTQSQSSYLPKEVVWGHRFPPVVKYDSHKQKYVIEHQKLDATEPVETPFCSAEEILTHSLQELPEPGLCPATPSSFSEKISSFQLGRSSSFRKKATNG